MMRNALDPPAVESDADAGDLGKGLTQHIGSGMQPGSRLEIWFLQERLGELECKVLTKTRLEFHAWGRFLGQPFDAPGKIELAPWGRCTIEIGHRRDAEACYSLQHKRVVLISEDFNGHAPSLRFWADKAETKVELRYTAGRFRPKFDVTIAPPRSPR